jgi:aryl-alcohol dehydrogenase-like predicted oxidoreductase
MRYKLLGRSGLRVSEVCLGTMTFGESTAIGADKAECRRVFDAYVDRGGNFLDTANKYMGGTSEQYVGEFVADRRSRFVIATKYSLSMDPSDPNACGNHRKNMVQAVEASLRRLGTDYIDLYWLHAWDYMTPVEEVMRGLDDLVRAGKVVYVGVSDTPAWIVSQANMLAQLRGWSPFVALQIEYSLAQRTVERELIPMARALGLAVTPWSPLAGGLLTGKHQDGTAADSGRGMMVAARQTERNRRIVDCLLQVAREAGRTPSQIALAWLRAQGADITPILGARKLPQLLDNLGYLDVKLAPEQLSALHEASKIELGFPHDFLSSPFVREVVYGKTYDLIDR